MLRFLPRFSLVALVLLSPVAAQSADRLHLKYATFDPLTDRPAVPAALRSAADSQLWIVQSDGAPTEAWRRALRATGATLHSYLPDNAYVVRMRPSVADRAGGLAGVRWIGRYEPAYRLEAFLRAELRSGDVPARRYHIVVVDKHADKPALMAAIRAIGGRIDHEQVGSILLDATLTGAQLVQVAGLDQVLWIDRWSAPEVDMNNARIQGGANYVEQIAGYTGQGINGHVYEGIERTHPDFTTPGINVRSGGEPQDHGHCTAGIVFGNGTSHPNARGMAPDTVPFYTNYSSVNGSRWQVVQELVTQHDVMFTTASWGDARTRQYTSISADADDIIFDHDIPWTQSQSNAGNQDSRPQAWAKNIFSIGGFAHRDNSNPADDSWRAGNGSTGPAADGRIKPDLSAYYEAIHCSDRTGSAGYSSGNSYTNFGGTSGATPIVAGHNALAIQMFTDGIFGNTLRVPGGTRFQNRPHFTTLKALEIANATQYPFNASSTDNRREHVGWGFPSLRSMWDNRMVHFIVDETDVVTQGNGTRWVVSVGAGRPELKISMCFADPAGNPAASMARINDLSVRVTSPSGVQYWGNNGLTQGNYSVPGSVADNRDTVENVFVANPQAGMWLIDVFATLVAQDTHVETPAVDADYGLVVNGGNFVSQTPITAGTFRVFGSGCNGSVLSSGRCVALNDNGNLQGLTTRANVGYALQVTAPQALTVLGFEYLSSSGSGSQTLQTRLYRQAANGAPGDAAANGTMTVGSSAGWYQSTFGMPVSVAAGETFFVFFQNTGSPVQASVVGSGTNVPYYRNDGSGGSWTGPYTQYPWALRIDCPGGPVPPVLDATGTPQLGGSYRVNLSRAVAGAGASMLLGASNTSSPFGSLPLALDAFGAQGCALLVSPDALLGGSTSAEGSLSLLLDVPNDPNLVDGRVYHQFFVLDTAANTLGLVVTNGGEAVIGY